MKKLLPLFLPATLTGFVAVLAACGGVVFPEDDAGPDDVGLNDSGFDAAASETSDSAPPAPDGSTCVRSDDRVKISVSIEGGSPKVCAQAPPDGTPATMSWTASVTQAGTDWIEVDTCPPWGDCSSQTIRISAIAPGLDLSATPRDSYVKVDVAFRRVSGCTSHAHVTSLATWGSTKNPVDVGGRIYLAAVEGDWSTGSSPYAAERLPTGCRSGKSCIDMPVDWYVLRFHASSGASATPLIMPMGTTAAWSLTIGTDTQKLTVRNLRSYYEGLCDAYSDFAWWMAPKR